MKFIEFKKNISENPHLFSLPMFYLEEQPINISKRKILFSKFYNGNYILDPFYKNIHRLI
ncbi:hypothetical protein QF024_002671 [Chryseobacterium nepalense]|nr:hypothetical protein [Chryseobacterium nepalense]